MFPCRAGFILSILIFDAKQLQQGTELVPPGEDDLDSRHRDERRGDGPYLAELDGDVTQSVTVMEWARYLGATFGTEGAVAALRFYEDVDWISPSVRRTMVDYVRGLSLDELTGEGDGRVDLGECLDTLEDTPFEKHAKSLEYVASIAGDSLEYDLVPLRLPEDGATPPTAPATSEPQSAPDGGTEEES
jgi:hypothetical protein